MFRIDRKNIKIVNQDNIYNPVSDDSDQGPLMVAASDGLQPSLYAGEELEEARRRAKETLSAAKERGEEIITEAQLEAEEFLKKAKDVGEILLQDARANAREHAEIITKEAYDEGFAQGSEAARQEVYAKQEALEADLATLVDAIEKGRNDALARMEGDIVNLSLAIAQKLMYKALDINDEAYAAIIENALNQMKLEGKILIRINRQDAARLFENGVATFNLAGSIVTATISPDPHMERGDIIIESDAEIVDAGIKSQVKAISIAFSEGGGDK